MILFHYTSLAAAPLIHKQGKLRGFPCPLLPQIGPIVWLTDLDVGHPTALGIPDTVAGYARMAVRVQVDIEEPIRWARWARRTVRHEQWMTLEVNVPGSLVAHWWLSLVDVPILSMSGWQPPRRKEK